MSKERIEQIRQRLDDWKVDGVLITNPENVRWLSGFTGSNATLVITSQAALLGTDFRYFEQAAAEAPDFELIKMGASDGLTDFHELVDAAAAVSLGIEGDEVTINQLRGWQKSVKQLEHEIVFRPLSQGLDSLRQIKTSDELAIMRRAAAITDLAMGEVNQMARPGMTEQELAWELEKMMRENGADGLAFDIIVASGPNAAKAHHHPGGRTLQAGDAIVIDMGATVEGYRSDLTRSFFLGNEPDDKFNAVYNLVLTAQQNALNHMKAGMTGAEIDALARDIIEDAGQGKNFGHSLGHGVGLYIHEHPRLSFRNSQPIPAGVVVTVEPGVYLPGWGGVRIEDLVVVGEDGIEFLSHCPKNPIIPV